jgi:hypothetical protein
MQRLWDENKPRGYAVIPLTSALASASITSTSNRPPNSFRTWMSNQQVKPNLVNEYDRYYAADITFNVKPSI